MVRILISRTPQSPASSPQMRLLFCPIKKLIQNVKVKDYLEIADISGEDIFHISDCCQNYPHVSQKIWIIIWFLAGLMQIISCVFAFPSSLFFFLSYLLFHLLRLNFFTQEHTPFSIMSSSLMCFNQWHSTNHVMALFTDSLSYSI